MGLKCSVLGHAYGETTVERDREERGSEVVITIRELETCDRCGDTRVVTENKEVTTIEAPGGGSDVTAADAMAAMDAEDERDADVSDADTSATGVADAGVSDAGVADAEADGVETDDVGTATATGPSTGEIPPAGEDDAEVIVDDAEGGDVGADDSADTAAADDGTGGADAETSGAGAVEDQGAEILDAETSAEEDAPVDDELADPTLENDADVPGDSAEDEDAVILEDDDTDAAADGTATAGTEQSAAEPTPDSEPGTDAGAAATDEPGPFDPPADDDEDDPLGEWPEETLRDEEDDDWTPTEDLTGTVGDVDPDANTDRGFSTKSAVTVPEGEFHCEECGYTTAVEASSLRAGDFCPECRTGTLIHRPEE